MEKRERIIGTISAYLAGLREGFLGMVHLLGLNTLDEGKNCKSL